MEIFPAAELTSRSNQPVGASAYLQQKLTKKLLTPNYNSSFILAILTNRSHQFNSIILLGLCLSVVVYNETRWPMLNLHLSYKPPSSCRVLFRSGDCHRKVSCLKKFRAPVFPVRGCRKRIIIQGVQLKQRLSCVRQLFFRSKGNVTGESLHTSR